MDSVSQSIDLQKSYIFMMSWMCWGAKFNLQPTSDLFFIFYLSSVHWPTTTFSSDIHLPFVIIAWIKIQSCMLRFITLHGRLSHTKYDPQISLSFWSWVIHLIQSMQSITKVLVFHRHKTSLWHTSASSFWREIAEKSFGENYLTDFLSKHLFISPSYSKFFSLSSRVMVFCSQLEQNLH